MLRISDLKKKANEEQSGREVEAKALENAATMLRHCQENWEAKNIKELLFEALRYNQTIWTIIKRDLENPDNPLTPELKTNIRALADFINKRTYELQSWPSKEKLNILIEINTNIAQGLRGQ